MVDHVKLKNHQERRKEIGQSWDLSIQRFINEKKINNCSDRTIHRHQDVLKYFIEFVRRRKIEMSGRIL